MVEEIEDTMDILGRVLYAIWVSITILGIALTAGVTILTCVGDDAVTSKEFRQYLSGIGFTILALLTVIYLRHVLPPIA